MLNDKKDLRGGLPLWLAGSGGRLRTRAKMGAETCDVAIVGGGVSGALIALTLSRAGLDVVVVDRRQPGQGSTGASTAMIQFELDTSLRELSGKIGASRAFRAYRRSLKAVADLKALTAAENIRCEWRDRDAVYLAGDHIGYRGLKLEAATRRRAGLPSEFLSADELKAKYGVERTGAILSAGAGEINPVRLLTGALNAARARGCRIYAGHEVIEVQNTAIGIRLATDKDGEILCKKAVFATGYETIKSLPKGRFDITSSWAIATKRVPPGTFWPTRCLLWEASDPYLYVRTTADNRVLAGGEDSGLNDAERRDAAIPAKAATLLNKLNALLPGRSFEIDYAWGGAFAVSPTGLPIFAEIDDHPGCMAILACGGNGITFSLIAAQVVEAWVKGRRDPDASLFEHAGP